MERKILTRADLPTEQAGWMVSLDHEGVIRLDPYWWELPLRLTFLLVVVVCCCFFVSFATLLCYAQNLPGTAITSKTPFFVGIFALWGWKSVQITRWRLGKGFIEEERVFPFRSSRRRYHTGYLVISSDSHRLSVWPLGERERVIVDGDFDATRWFGLFVARETGWRLQRR